MAKKNTNFEDFFREGNWNLHSYLDDVQTLNDQEQMEFARDIAREISEGYIIDHFGFSPQDPNLLLLNKAYTSGLETIASRNTWVGSAINLNMKFTSQAPVAIKEKGMDELIPIEDTEFEFLKVPNSYMRLKEMIRAVSFWLDVCGEAFIYLEREGMMLPDQIHVIPPWMMSLKYLGEDAKLQWFFTNPLSGEGRNYAEAIPTHKIIHLKNYGVSRLYGSTYYEQYGNPVRGVSPALPIMSTLATDEGVSRFLNIYTSGKALLSGVISPAKDQRLARGQARELMENIKQQINRFTESQKLLIFPAPLDYTESTFNPFDLSQKEIKDITKKEACAIYGCNPILLGDFEDIQSYEGIKTAEKVYYHISIMPRLDEIEDAINQAIFMFHKGGRYMLDFDLSKVEALDDYDIRLERAAKARDLGYTLNQVNQMFRLGFKKVKHGDEPGPPQKPMGMDGDAARKRKSRDSADPDEKDDTDRKRKDTKK